MGEGGSHCLSPSLCILCTGTKAGFVGFAQSMEGVVCIMLGCVSVSSYPGAARGRRRGASLCTGRWLAGGLRGCRGHRGSGRVTVQGARGAWSQWRAQRRAPPRAPRPSWWEGGGGVPWPGGVVHGQRPSAGHWHPAGLGGGSGSGRGSAVPLLPIGPPVHISAALPARRLRGLALKALARAPKTVGFP